MEKEEEREREKQREQKKQREREWERERDWALAKEKLEALLPLLFEPLLPLLCWW